MNKTTLTNLLSTPTAKIQYFDPDGEVFFLGASSFPVPEVVEYIVACCDLDLKKAAKTGMLPPAHDVEAFKPLSSLHLLLESERAVKDHPRRPTNLAAQVAWSYCFNIQSPKDISRSTPDVVRRTITRAGYIVEVGPKPGQLGFQLLDQKGKIIPMFTLRNAPTEEVLSLLRGPELLAEIAAL